MGTDSALYELEGEAIVQITNKMYEKYWALELTTVGQFLICDPSLSHNHWSISMGLNSCSYTLTSQNIKDFLVKNSISTYIRGLTKTYIY